MKILAFETSAKSASVAITENDKIIASDFQNEGLTHSKTVLKMYENLNATHNLSPNDIDVIAVTTGPGSYTGVRIGVSVAQGLALALNKPCVSVSSLEALACNEKSDGIIVCVMDARRDQVYNAIFKREKGILTRLCDDRCIQISDLESELQDNSITLVGDASFTCKEAFTKSDCKICDNIFGLAQSVCEIAKTKEKIDVTELMPVYLKM